MSIDGRSGAPIGSSAAFVCASAIFILCPLGAGGEIFAVIFRSMADNHQPRMERTVTFGSTECEAAQHAGSQEAVGDVVSRSMAGKPSSFPDMAGGS